MSGPDEIDRMRRELMVPAPGVPMDEPAATYPCAHWIKRVRRAEADAERWHAAWRETEDEAAAAGAEVNRLRVALWEIASRNDAMEMCRLARAALDA